jgi:glyoxylase-like metal-dependent hydrolase (beta-lactamase superfamily II)/rhodanese-related sulfurtransferase
MKIEQIYTGCLAEAAYYIESAGEAVIIDPLRETEPYIRRAKVDGARIKYILETHFHADFVSGHLDLAAKTGAKIVYGPTASPDFEIHQAYDGEILQVGKVKIKVLHTPGHTMESSSYLLYDEEGKMHSLYTGDTLFINEVGRPDLAVKTDRTKEDLARLLFKSLREKIMTLPDDVVVYPGHGAGSACGKNIGKERHDSIGNQKQVNYALRSGMTEDEFVKEVLAGTPPPPQYFPKNAVMNKQGYTSFDLVLAKGTTPLSGAAFEALANQDGMLVLDTRSSEEFAAGHIPNSVFIGIDGNFAPWVGTLITNLNQPILLLVPEGREVEVVTRLARVGYDNTLGFLQGGLSAWQGDVEQVQHVDAPTFETLFLQGGLTVLDLRKPGEYAAQHLQKVENFPLDYLNENMWKLDPAKRYYLHCQGGYRSMIAASILLTRGITDIVNVNGGFEAISKTSVPTTAAVCPSTLK